MRCVDVLSQKSLSSLFSKSSAPRRSQKSRSTSLNCLTSVGYCTMTYSLTLSTRRLNSTACKPPSNQRENYICKGDSIRFSQDCANYLNESVHGEVQTVVPLDSDSMVHAFEDEVSENLMSTTVKKGWSFLLTTEN